MQVRRQGFEFGSHHEGELAAALLREIGALAAWLQADPVSELAERRSELADVEALIKDHEARLPELVEAQTTAKERLDDLRARPGVDGNAVGSAHEIWVEAGVARSAVDGPLQVLAHERRGLRERIAELDRIKRPAAPTLEALVAELRRY